MSLIPDRTPLDEESVPLEAEVAGARKAFGPAPAYCASPYSSDPGSTLSAGEPSRWSPDRVLDRDEAVSSRELEPPNWKVRRRRAGKAVIGPETAMGWAIR